MRPFHATRTSRIGSAALWAGLLLLCWLTSVPAMASAADQPLRLQDLIDECLKNSPELRAFEARVDASKYRIPQAKSLPDPMLMFGYQNEGWRRITIGEETRAYGMFSLSQMFFFPGKRSLKEEMATRDAEGLAALYNAAKLRLAARIKELYYDLFLAYKTIDILQERTDLFSRVEDAAICALRVRHGLPAGSRNGPDRKIYAP